jgi:uncharacterized protein (DUF58 family)
VKGGFWWALLAVLFLIGVATQRGALVVFVLALALAAGASRLWAHYCLTNVTFRRRLASSQIAYGEETTLSLEFVNAKPLPLAWLALRDNYPAQVTLLTENPRTGKWTQRGSLSSVVSLRWYERVVLRHRIRGDQRGHFNFGPGELRSGDVFGFQQRERPELQVDTLIVYPKVVPIALEGVPSDRPLGTWLARRRVAEDALRFAAVREYVPGDNPRHIHWRASAHTGNLQSKVFDPSDTLLITLAVDVQTTSHAWGFVPPYLELLISAAASLGVQALNERYMVGLYANGLGRDGQGWIRVRPSRHPQQMNLLLAELALLDPFRGMSLAEMLRTVMPQLPFGATLIALSAIPEEPLYEALAALESAGHRTLLLTVGDTKPDVPERLSSYHLGGQDAWQHLETLELA